MATKSELATYVLRELKIIGNGETADANDSQQAQDFYDSIYHELAADHLVTWGSGDSIPTEAVIPVAQVVAYECQEAFGQVYDILKATKAKRTLAKLAAVEFVNEPIEATYY